MPIELISNRPLELGLQEIFFYLNDITGGLFINLFLVAIWSVVTFGLYFAQSRRTGSGDFSMSIAVAGFITSVTTILLRLVTTETGQHALVNNWTLGIVLVVAFISVLWFLLSRER